MNIAAEILDEYESLGPKGGSPMKRVLQQGREDPRFLEELVVDSLHRPLPHATFLDAALDLLDDAAYVRTTSEAWRRFRLGHRAAGLSRVLRSAMLQHPDVFADDWECLLQAQVDGADDLDRPNAWHALDEPTARQWLGWTTAAGIDDTLAHRRATALLHCEHLQVVRDAWRQLAPDSTTSSARYTLMSAGFAVEDGQLRGLHDPEPRHLLLGADQWEQMLAQQADWKRDIWLAQASWRPDGPVTAGALMGGALAGTCGLCHQPLHRLLALEDATGAPFAHEGPLTLATCLSCQGWEERALFFVHDVDGQAGPHRSQKREMPLPPHFPRSPCKRPRSACSRPPLAGHGRTGARPTIGRT